MTDLHKLLRECREEFDGMAKAFEKYGNAKFAPTIKAIREFVVRIDAALAEPQEQNVAHHDDGCICHGNWRAIVKESLPFLGKRFCDDKGIEYSFFGIVHGDDDYYYGMSSVPGNKVMLLSCVCEIAGHGYKLIDNDEQNVAPQPSTADQDTAPSQEGVGQGEAASVAPDCNCHPEDYPPVPCQRKRSYLECMRAALANAQMERDLAIEGSRRQMIRAEKAEDKIAALKRPGYVSVPRAEFAGLIAAAKDLCRYGNGDWGMRDRLRRAGKAMGKAMLAASGEGKP